MKEHVFSETPESERQLRECAYTLIDAIANPTGRDFASAWDDACLVFGRFDAEPKLIQAAAPRWIPTSERLPEVGEEVVFLWLGKRHLGMRVDETRWLDEDGLYYIRVQHWMPLPPLPSEET